MSYVYIGLPWPSDTVARTVAATGSADAGGADMTLTVTVYDSNNTVIASKSQVVSDGDALAWGVSFDGGEITADFYDCTLVVEMRPDGCDPNDPPFTDSVCGFDIVDSGGGTATFP